MRISRLSSRSPLTPLTSRALPFGLALAAALCAAAAACGGGSQQPVDPSTTQGPTEGPEVEPAEVAGDAGATEAPAPDEAPSADAGAPSVHFDDLSEDEKKQYMKNVVLPKMKELFVSVDAKHYGNMNCVNCHGASAKKGEFEMPNKDLPKLDPTGNFKKHDPAVVKFMAEQVVPQMAALLGEPQYDPKTQEGFGCFDCHTKK